MASASADFAGTLGQLRHQPNPEYVEQRSALDLPNRCALGCSQAADPFSLPDNGTASLDQV